MCPFVAALLLPRAGDSVIARLNGEVKGCTIPPEYRFVNALKLGGIRPSLKVGSPKVKISTLIATLEARICHVTPEPMNRHENRRLNSTDHLLNALSQALTAAAESSENRVESRRPPLDSRTSERLRGHHAMSSAARAFFVGRGISGAAPQESASTTVEQDAQQLKRTIDTNGVGTSLLLPAVCAGGFVLGAMNRLLAPDQGKRFDALVTQRATRARTDLDATLALAREAEDLSNENRRRAPSEASVDRRRQYSLRGGRSPSQRMLNATMAKVCDGLFNLTSKL